MAPKPEDDPKNRTLRAKSTKALAHFKKTAIGDFVAELSPLSQTKCYDHEIALSGFGYAFVIMALPLYGVVQLFEDPTTQTIMPEIDVSTPFSPDLSTDGYMALSSDNGANGYVLVRNDDDYRVYQFDRRYKYSEQHTLNYMEDQDEAWHVVKRISDDFANLNAIGNDPSTVLDAETWEVFSMGDISKFIVEEDGDIKRYAPQIAEYDVSEYGGLATSFSVLNSAWSEASVAIYNDQTGFSDETLEQDAGILSNEIIPFEETALDEYIGLGVFGLGGLLLAAGTIGPARRRRDYRMYGGYRGRHC